MKQMISARVMSLLLCLALVAGLLLGLPVNAIAADSNGGNIGDGNVKAVGKGKCTIYALAINGVRAKVKVTVK